MTLSRWLSQWYDLYLVPAGLRPSTLRMYRAAIAALPAPLGALELSALDASGVLALRAWIVNLSDRYPRAAQIDQQVMLRALRLAAELGLCRDFVTARTFPKVNHKARTAPILDGIQIQKYLSAAVTFEPVYSPLLCLCCCGLRRGEALGVQVADFDHQKQLLHICRQRIRVDGKYTVQDLKTVNSHRVLVLPPWLCDLLAAACAERRRGPWLVDATPEILHRVHKRVLDWADLPASVTLHGLRHSYATLAALHGDSLKTIAVSLGHSSTKLTDQLYTNHIYTSSLPAAVLPSPIPSLYGRVG